MNDSITIIATSVKKLREDIGLSQKDFANLANISTSTLINIESGKKSFRVSTLQHLFDITGLSLENLAKQDFKLPKNLRSKLLKTYEKDPTIFVILSNPPSLSYLIKNKILKTSFLDKPKEVNEIKKELMKFGLKYKGNSIHIALKRMPKFIEISKHETKKNTNVYTRKSK